MVRVYAGRSPNKWAANRVPIGAAPIGDGGIDLESSDTLTANFVERPSGKIDGKHPARSLDRAVLDDEPVVHNADVEVAGITGISGSSPPLGPSLPLKDHGSGSPTTARHTRPTAAGWIDVGRPDCLEANFVKQFRRESNGKQPAHGLGHGRREDGPVVHTAAVEMDFHTGGPAPSSPVGASVLLNDHGSGGTTPAKRACPTAGGGIDAGISDSPVTNGLKRPRREIDGNQRADCLDQAVLENAAVGHTADVALAGNAECLGPSTRTGSRTHFNDHGSGGAKTDEPPLPTADDDWVDVGISDSPVASGLNGLRGDGEQPARCLDQAVLEDAPIVRSAYVELAGDLVGSGFSRPASTSAHLKDSGSVRATAVKRTRHRLYRRPIPPGEVSIGVENAS